MIKLDELRNQHVLQVSEAHMPWSSTATSQIDFSCINRYFFGNFSNSQNVYVAILIANILSIFAPPQKKYLIKKKCK